MAIGVAAALGAIVASLWVASPAVRDDGLVVADIAHLAHLMQEATPDTEPITADDPTTIAQALDASGVRLPAELRDVRYLGRCGPPDHAGEHIVVKTEGAVASVVLMPRDTVSFHVVQFDDGRTAVVAPARVGSLAVVADSKNAAVRLAEQLR